MYVKATDSISETFFYFLNKENIPVPYITNN